ncbi:hypothetical protein AIOL_001935 [Candidatus Rhodobacter oscarellae]|uniref:Phage major tail protein n=1 Tax=Candidatus Rhodobacter oscarellae TaxID=1675527 RepID=A0A0J9E2P5_9RHOB|nr:hypothetical protein [Candidatus Rhodobacter lobularis]KMW56977.1 hypothetical protein AIOL_001935 [Candidatus Rhodobacter lobularis]
MGTGKQTHRFVIQLGDGAEQNETFAFTCGANSRNVTLTNNLGETTVLDCANPLDVVPTIIRYLESQDTSATIAGTVAMEAWPTWREWADGGTVKNVKLFMDESAANNGGHWIVPMMLQQLEFGNEGHGVVNFTANLQGAGKREWTDAA